MVFAFPVGGSVVDLPSVPPRFVSPVGGAFGRYSGPLDFFTDGSCLHQDSMTFRLAAWAVCVASVYDEKLNAGVGSSTVVAAAAIRGLVQTAFRAELTAVAAALYYGASTKRPLRIWSDCQGVIRRFTALVQGCCQLKANAPNADFWCLILDLVDNIGSDKITIRKVAAHQELSVTASPFEQWVHHHNAAVDRAAREANMNRPGHIWRLWEQLALQTCGLQRLCSDILHFQLQVCQQWTQHSKEETSIPVPREPRVKTGPPMAFQVDLPSDGPSAVVCRELGRDQAHRLWAWWSEFLDLEGGHVRWISFAQMYIHYQLTQRHPGSVRLGKKWLDPSLNPVLQPEQYAFKVRSRWFRRQLQFIWKKYSWQVGTGTVRPFSRRLACFVGCASVPARQDGLELVEHWLEQNAQPVTGQGETLNLLPLAW